MTPEDEEFNRIEREAKQRMEAVKSICRTTTPEHIKQITKPWVGLTAGEVFDVLVSVDKETVRLPSMLGIFARAIEEKLREKNT